MDKWDIFIRIFSKDIRTILKETAVDYDRVQEIRLRVQAPLLLIYGDQEFYLTSEGTLTTRRELAFQVTGQAIRETLEYIGSHSLYAFEEEIRQGFLTIQGGHRIGLAGKTILDERGIRTMKFISFLNVRLAHELRGCADGVIPYLYDQAGLCHTLLISPPRCGKTTLLRDLVRQISDGSEKAGAGTSRSVSRPGMTVGVVDERSEIGACYQGVPQNDLGIRTDILDCCPKALGMMMLIRSMSPQVVAVDEIGSREDLDAVEQVMNCGSRVLATVHGSSLEDIRRKPVLKTMLAERWFGRYVVLENKRSVGQVEGIYDSGGRRLFPGEAGV